MPSRSSKSRASSSRKAQSGVSKRAQVVWAALVASMTAIGGALFLLDGGKPVISADGVALPALMNVSTPNSLEAILSTREPLRHDLWSAIVIHDSGSPIGSPASLEQQARAMNLNGLGYHFVIGNGNGMGDGEVHVGARWLRQSLGAHVAGPQGESFNRSAIGICLVGDGNRGRFSPAQIDRLVALVETLRREFNIPADRVYLHSQLANTQSPGRLFPVAAFREALSN
jgi:hypothetical protein